MSELTKLDAIARLVAADPEAAATVLVEQAADLLHDALRSDIDALSDDALARLVRVVANDAHEAGGLLSFMPPRLAERLDARDFRALAQAAARNAWAARKALAAMPLYVASRLAADDVDALRAAAQGEGERNE